MKPGDAAVMSECTCKHFIFQPLVISESQFFFRVVAQSCLLSQREEANKNSKALYILSCVWDEVEMLPGNGVTLPHEEKRRPQYPISHLHKFQFRQIWEPHVWTLWQRNPSSDSKKEKFQSGGRRANLVLRLNGTLSKREPAACFCHSIQKGSSGVLHYSVLY